MKINATIALLIMGVWFYTGLIWQTAPKMHAQLVPSQCTLKITDRVGFAHLVTGESQ